MDKYLRRKFKRGWVDSESLIHALKHGFVLFLPQKLAKNPVMFVTGVGAGITTLVVLTQGIQRDWAEFTYGLIVSVVLWITVYFANFAEALAEARGKAQAKTLRATRESTLAHRVHEDGTLEKINSTLLISGDVVKVSAGEIIPADGEVIAGIASVDESAITGESAPVIRESGGDRTGVTGGTRVLSDWIHVQVSTDPGESFLERMIALVEGATRQKTPNELAMSVTLSALTLGFMMVILTLPFMAHYFGISVSIPTLVALLVCLIPTTIGALLSAIGLAGMDRALKANIVAKSGKAVELCGDLDTLLLDKTGTITVGNRQATALIPVNGVSVQDLARAALWSSWGDQTSEGKSLLSLAQKSFLHFDAKTLEGSEHVPFSAQTRLSKTVLGAFTAIKGAKDAVIKEVARLGGKIPADLETKVRDVARSGATPLVIAINQNILGVSALSDILKPDITDRIGRLRRMGLRVVMVTGDNELTAAHIAAEAGVDDFIAEATPEDKLQFIRAEQDKGRLVAMMGDGVNDAPALAQADVGVAMNSGTQAAKEAANMVDLDNDPTKLIEAVEIGKQLLMTRGAITTFSIANDIAKYFAIVPALFALAFPALKSMDIMGLSSPQSAVLSAVIFNALIIPVLIPLALKGVQYAPIGAKRLLARNLLVYGLGGVIIPFLGIKGIDLILSAIAGNFGG
jgi:K+-transporting ATPase ATPase B chain